MTIYVKTKLNKNVSDVWKNERDKLFDNLHKMDKRASKEALSMTLENNLECTELYVYMNIFNSVQRTQFGDLTLLRKFLIDLLI